MPTYVYKFVKTGETIEVQQAFTDDTLTKIKHPETGRQMAVKKVFQPVGVTFKGSGFFKTDNRGSQSSQAPGSSSESASSSDSSSSNDSGSSSSKESSSSSKDSSASSSASSTSSTPAKSSTTKSSSTSD